MVYAIFGVVLVLFGVLGIFTGAALWLVGPAHPTLAGSRSLAVVEQLQTLQNEGALPTVTAPGPWH